MRDSETEMTVKNLQTLYGELEEYIKDNDLRGRIGIKGDIQVWIADITGRNKAHWKYGER